MFTGLVEEIGTIKELKKGDKSLYISIKCDKVLEKLPSYLKYDTEENMRADLEQMISIL